MTNRRVCQMRQLMLLADGIARPAKVLTLAWKLLRSAAEDRCPRAENGWYGDGRR